MATKTNRLPTEMVVKTESTVTRIIVESPGGIKLKVTFEDDGSTEDYELDGCGITDIGSTFLDEILISSEEDFRDFVMTLGALREEYSKTKFPN